MDVGIDRPYAAGRLLPVNAWWHPNVDEGDRIGPAFAQGCLDGLNGIKPPIVERAIKRRDGPFSRARSAEGLSGRAGRAAISFEAAAIDLLHGGIIIDDQQAHRC